MTQTFTKSERLKSKILIGKLFAEGQSVSAYPLLLVFKPVTLPKNIKAQVGFSVSKKRFKRAVDRNRIKRLMREAYRLNKATYYSNMNTQYVLMIIYLNNHLPAFSIIETQMNVLFNTFIKKHKAT